MALGLAAYAGSFEATNADAVVSQIGLTGLPVRVIFNGCATGNALLASAAKAIEQGEHDVVVAVGMDKHPRGAFSADPAASGHPDLYAEAGLFLTMHYFGMKINRYMHEFGISHQTLAKVAAKNLRIGEMNP
ncbi:thiolase family protein, partial [Mycobacterium seoulense]